MKFLLSIPKLWRWLGILLLTVLLNALAFYRMPLEEDVVASIERSRPKEAELFRQVQELGLFQNRLFIKVLDPGLIDELNSALPGFGFQLVSFGPTATPQPESLLQLLAFLPLDTQNELLNPERIPQLVDQSLRAISLPGGLGFIKMLENDPLGMAAALGALSGGGVPSSPGSFLVASRTGPLDFEQTQKLYDFLQKRDKGLHFLSGDFFALENKAAVQRDIAVCSLVSLLLGGLCFYFFSRQWRVLVLLFVGTLFSAAIGLLTARAVDGVIYGLVLAFTSTFFSFNNESLVHGAGLQRHSSRSVLIGVASAIGTTVLGFLVLLFSSSHMARQMALISLASMAGFIVFLYVFRSELGTLKFRSISLRRLPWKRGPSLLCSLGLLILISILPKPAFRTDLNSFRFTSSYLDEQVKLFSKASSRFDFSGLQAIPLNSSSVQDFQTWDHKGLFQTDMFHPLRLYQNETEQTKRLAALTPQLDEWLKALQKALLDVGVRISLPTISLKMLSLPQYLQLWTVLSPLPWTLQSEGQDFLIINSKGSQLFDHAIPLHPKSFYEWILNDLSTQIAQLFLVGLLLMALYLIPWQRSAHKIALIFMPLLLACLVLQLLFLFTGRTLNIVHIMGASLVIAVALDYSSILISTEHDPEDQGKVVLTGGLTLTSFGGLALASHPLLRELGLIVFIGTAVSWVFALVFCRAQERPL